MKMHCWKCTKDMKQVKDTFHGFEVDAWKCSLCKEIIYDEKAIQPILQYNKMKGLSVKVGFLGKSTMFRFPKVAEQIYGIHRGEKLPVSLEPGRIVINLTSARES